MFLRANRKNLKECAKEILGVEYTPKKERELIDICTKDNYTNYIEGREHRSFAIVKYMEKINDIIGTFGVESCFPEIPDLYYCNSGDTYNITILYYKGKLYIGDWGSVAEKYL